MNTPLDLRAGVVAHLKSTLPNQVRVDPHPGRFDIAELGNYAVHAPAVRVAVLSGPVESLGDTVLLRASVAAYVITTAGREYTADEHSLALCALLLPAINCQTFGVASDDPEGLSWQNLYSTEQNRKGAHLAAATWTQAIELPFQVDASTLDDFLRFSADWDLGPAPDGQIEARDAVHVPGASAPAVHRAAHDLARDDSWPRTDTDSDSESTDS